MAKYKTKNGHDYILPGIGRTVNGVIETTAKIENPNFELVSEAEASAQTITSPAAATSQSAPAPAQQPAPAVNQEGK